MSDHSPIEKFNSVIDKNGDISESALHTQLNSLTLKDWRQVEKMYPTPTASHPGVSESASEIYVTNHQANLQPDYSLEWKLSGAAGLLGGLAGLALSNSGAYGLAGRLGFALLGAAGLTSISSGAFAVIDSLDKPSTNPSMMIPKDLLNK